jgi:hypothetical protein
VGDLSMHPGKQKQFGLSGNSAQDISDWFLKHAPDVDPLSLQSHVLLNRVYMQISAKNEVGKESLRLVRAVIRWSTSLEANLRTAH